MEISDRSTLFASLGLLVLVNGLAIHALSSAKDACDVSSAASATIGGPFELVDSEGDLVTDMDVLTRPALIYFGYTFCPDVCPFDMARNAIAVDLLAEQGHEVSLVFISVDPERDTPEILGQYSDDMFPKMMALTGSMEQVKAAATAYHVYYAKGVGSGDFYLVDHSTFTYLMFPGNKPIAYFNRDKSAEDIAKTTKCLIES
ncbi:MAG: SCO family protein [Boseongicola sp.]|nr:SCO family protein [Boseongicola sp.]